MKDTAPVSILLVDDHQIIREGIAILLEDSSYLAVAKSVGSANEAQDCLEKDYFDLVLTDISMPEKDGIELCKWIKSHFPDTKVLFLSMHDDTNTIAKAIRAEADGYLLKNSGKEELVKAIEKVVGGGTHYSQSLMPILAKLIHKEHVVAANIKPLSDREIEILKLVCDDKSTNQIAEMLHISPKTVETHRKNILKKTETKSAIGLMKFALSNQLVHVE